MPNPIPTEAAASKVVEAGQAATLGDTKAYTPTEGGVPDFTISTDDPFIGASIGRYCLLKKLGEGGMGTVYLAEQSEPVKRLVALKLIRGNFDSRTIIARFEAERQALAVMDHPNIARIYDGGVDSPRSTGSPLAPGGKGIGGEGETPRIIHHAASYFVMELVQGVPITEYCDQHRLSPKQRLELFVPICQAVQHAHQKGIIHRDLKPSNVLVTEVDGKPIPKVIDFGVAKATEQPLTDQSLGDTGAIVGTPMYMSPEQADPESMDIDTRTDIYALGVMLYELLTGSPPIDARQFKRGAVLEVLRMVREVDPPRPSTKLSTAEGLPSIAANRNIEPKQLQAMLRGDVDWIVMKAIEKDRTRRYETANGFAADVQRYLTGEAVLAHPPGRWYLLAKFVKRNWGQVVAAGLVLLALIVGLAVSLWQMNRAILAESKAVEERDEKDRQWKRAETNEMKARESLAQWEKGNDILTSIFNDLDLRVVKASAEPLEVVLSKRLVKAAKDLDGNKVGDPLVVARLQDQLGCSLLSLGFPQDAIPLLVKSKDARTSLLNKTHKDTLASVHNLAAAYQATGKTDLALPLFLETYEITRVSMGVNHPDTVTCLSSLAVCYQQAGKLDLAIKLLEENFKKSQPILQHDDNTLLTVMNNIAVAYQDSGKLNEAMPLYEAVLSIRKNKLGVDHPDTLVSMNNLAEGYHDLGLMDKAIPLMEQTLKLRRLRLGMDHPHTLSSMNNLALAYQTINKLELAIPLLEEALTRGKAVRGVDHPETISDINNLATLYQSQGKLDLALPLFEEAVKGLQKRNYQHEYASIFMNNLFGCHERLKQFERAETLRKQWMIKVLERAGKNSIEYGNELVGLGQNQLAQLKWVEAEVTLRECLTLRDKNYPDVWSTFSTMSLLGSALLHQKKYADAEPFLKKGYEGLETRQSTIPKKSQDSFTFALDRLIQLYTETNKPEEVKKWQAEKSKLSKPVEKKN